MTDTEHRKRAEAMYREVTVSEPGVPQDPFTEATLDQVFGSVWTRPGLDRKERRWITLATVAMTGSPVAIEHHVSSALASGDISRDEFNEFVLHFAHYAGWPLAATVYGVFRKWCAQADAEMG